MRALCPIVVPFAVAAAMAVPAKAADTAASAPTAVALHAEPSHAERLGRLFGQLRRQSDPDIARRTADSIRAIWQDSGSATVDLLMQWAQKAIADKRYGTALDLLDQVIVLEPDYAEGWNRRATVHYLMNDYKRSMVDIDRVLTLEPRQFDALFGMAGIFAAIGKDDLAVKALERVLAVYPADRRAQKQFSELTEKLTGDSI